MYECVDRKSVPTGRLWLKDEITVTKLDDGDFD